MTAGDWGGIAAAIVIVLGGVGTLIGLVTKQFSTVIEELKSQLKSALEQIEHKQESIDELYELQTDCETEAAEMNGWIIGANAWIKGQPGGSVVPDPPKRRTRTIERASYLQKRASQNTKITTAVVGDLTKGLST